MASSRAKCWTATIFDINNFSSELLQQIGNGISYAIIGEETCPSTSRKHLQCYFKFNAPVRFSTLIAKLPRGGHIEKAKGTPFQNYQYCSKETIREEIGTRPEPPNRKRKSTELQSELLEKYCKSEITLKDMIDEDNIFVMKNFTKIQQIKSFLTEDRNIVTELYLILGEPGIGKTTFATTLSKSHFIKTANTEKWWDGYQQQDVVILDDFYGWLQPAELFNLADSKPHQVQIKGGFTKFNSKAIVITSNKIPEMWWKRSTVLKYDMRAFDRRVTLTWKRSTINDESQFGYNFDYNLTSD